MISTKIITIPSGSGGEEHRLILSAPRFDLQSLRAAAVFASEHADMVLTAKSTFSAMYTDFTFGESISLNELEFWRLALASKAADSGTVAALINSILVLTPDNSEVAEKSDSDSIGQEALSAALSHFDPGDQSLTEKDSDYGVLLELYARYLQKNNARNREEHLPLLQSAIEHAHSLDHTLFAKLFNHRLRLWETGFEELYRYMCFPKALMFVLDSLVDQKSSAKDKTVSILQLCAVLYGSQTDLSDFVLAHYGKAIELVPEGDLHRVHRKRIDLYRGIHDIYWKSRVNVWARIDSGFHVFDRRDMSWRRNIARPNTSSIDS